MTAVECEHFAQLPPLRNNDERGVSEVHRQVSILGYQLMHAWQVGRRDFGDIEPAIQEELPKELRFIGVVEKVESFCEHRQRRDQSSSRKVVNDPPT